MICLVTLITLLQSRQLFLKSLFPDYDSSDPLPSQSSTHMINVLQRNTQIEMFVNDQFEFNPEGFRSFWAKREDDFEFPHSDLLRKWFVGDLSPSEMDSLKSDPDGLGTYHFITIMDGTFEDIGHHVTELTELAMKGSAMSQFVLGFLYSTGLYVNTDLARGIIYLKHSSNGRNIFGGLDMASRHLHGLSLSKTCHLGNDILNRIARVVVANMSRWESTIGEFPKLTRDRHSHISWDSSQSVYINYLSLFFSKQTSNQIELVKFYLGDVAYNPDSLKLAFDILTDAHSHGSVEASSYLGHFYLEGTPFLKPDYKLARSMFELGEAKNVTHSFIGLGMIYLYGLGVDVDYSRATYYLNITLSMDKYVRDGSGFLHFGIMKLFALDRYAEEGPNPRDLFTYGSYMKNIPSIYFLGHRGLDMLASCSVSAQLNQVVVENGPWRLLAMKAYRLWKMGKVRQAYNYYTFLVEIGVRDAMENAAHILYQDLKGPKNFEPQHSTGRLFQLLNRLGKLNDGEAHKILANMYYYGIGVQADMTEAFHYYMLIIDMDVQAQFNVGYMYEHGLGVAKSISSAEAYYRSAGQFFETWLSSRLAILKMKLVDWVDRSRFVINLAVAILLLLISAVVFSLNLRVI